MSKADEIKKKNKIYCVEGDPDYGCIYVAAKNGKCARTMGLGTWVAGHLYNPYIEMRVLRKWGIETDYEGELDIYQINELGLTWWSCPECDKEEFEILDRDKYKCKNCGKEFKIPYVD